MSQTSLSHLTSVAILAVGREGDGKFKGESGPAPEEPSLAGKQTRDQDTKTTPSGKSQTMDIRFWSRCGGAWLLIEV